MLLILLEMNLNNGLDWLVFLFANKIVKAEILYQSCVSPVTEEHLHKHCPHPAQQLVAQHLRQHRPQPALR